MKEEGGKMKACQEIANPEPEQEGGAKPARGWWRLAMTQGRIRGRGVSEGKADWGDHREGGGVFLRGLACEGKLFVAVRPEGSSPGRAECVGTGELV